MNQKKIQESILVVDEARFSFSASLLPLSILSPIFIPAIKHNYYLQRNFIDDFRPIRDKNFLFNSVFWPVYFIIVPLDSLESTKKKYEWRGGVIDEADRTKGNYEFPGELSGIKYYTLSPMNNLIEVEISPRAGGKHQFIFDLNFK